MFTLISEFGGTLGEDTKCTAAHEPQSFFVLVFVARDIASAVDGAGQSYNRQRQYILLDMLWIALRVHD